MSSPYLDRLLRAAMRRRDLDTLALRALMRATHLLGLALAGRLREYRDGDDPALDRFAQIQEQVLHASLLREALDVLGSRWDKLPEHRRPHYSPQARFRILRLRALLAPSAVETARTFRVSTGTVLRWESEAQAKPDRGTVGSLLKPDPPVRRFADAVRHVVQTLTLAGFPGDASVAAHLARAGWRLSRRNRPAHPQGEARGPPALAPPPGHQEPQWPDPLPPPRLDVRHHRDTGPAPPLLLQARRRLRRLVPQPPRRSGLPRRAKRGRDRPPLLHGRPSFRRAPPLGLRPGSPVHRGDLPGEARPPRRPPPLRRHRLGRLHRPYRAVLPDLEVDRRPSGKTAAPSRRSRTPAGSGFRVLPLAAAPSRTGWGHPGRVHAWPQARSPRRRPASARSARRSRRGITAVRAPLPGTGPEPPLP